MFREKLRAQILDGVMQSRAHHLEGFYRGYHITIENLTPSYVVRINADSPEDEGNGALAAFAQEQKKVYKLLQNMEVTAHYIALYIKSPNLAKNIPAAINEVTNAIITYLINGGYSSGCGNCGSTTAGVACYLINGQHYLICEDCVERVKESLQGKQEDIVSQKSDLVPGLVGAFLGSLIGCVLWVLIYKLGYIAGIAGLVTGICAMKGYEMLGKHLDKKGVIGSVIVMVVMIFFANKVAWSLEAYSALKEYGYSFSDCFKQLGDILSVNDITALYYKDLIIGYFLTLIASWRRIASALKTSTGSYSIKRADK